MHVTHTIARAVGLALELTAVVGLTLVRVDAVDTGAADFRFLRFGLVSTSQEPAQEL